MNPARSLKFWLAASAAFVFGAGVFVSRVLGAYFSLKILTPITLQQISGNTVTVRFVASGIKLVDPRVTPRNGYGQGHVHLWLDQANPTKLSAIKVSSEGYVFQNVPYGNHTLRAEIVNNDHSSLVPPVVAVVNFTTVPTTKAVSSQMLMVASAAFLFVALTLYFVNYRHPIIKAGKKSTSAKKSSRR